MTRAVCMSSGAFLPMRSGNARDTADGCGAHSLDVDSARKPDMMKSVDVPALPPRALFASLHRYPSPEGWPVALLRWPSFFYFCTIRYGFRQRIAHFVGCTVGGFDRARGIAPCGPHERQLKQRAFSCDKDFGSLWFPWCSRVVGIPRSSKPSSARGRVWARRRSLTRTLPSARRSEPQATSFTARPIRGAVDATATKPHGGKFCFCSHWLGGSFGVVFAQWGASNERGAEYGHYRKSSDLVGGIGRVQRARGVEPNGVRPLSADTNHGITPRTGPAAGPRHETMLTKALEPSLGGSGAFVVSIAERRDDRCSRRS